MARRFNGSSDYIVFTLSSALESLDAGPMTIAVCAKMNDTTDGAFIHARTSGGTNSWWMECGATNWNYGQGVAARDVGDLSTGDNWVVLIGRKADGGANAPRGRKIVLGGSTTDVTAGSGLADGTAPGSGGILQVGRWGTASEYIGADIAAVAVWGSDLSDGNTATMTTYAAWLALSPAWCVAFDQANAADPIDDDSSTGTGDSSSITGTTIVADPSGFFSAGGTTYNQNVSGAITPTGALVRQAAKASAGSVTPTGALTRQAGKALGGTVTPSGSLTKLTARAFAGTLSAAGTLVKQTSKRLLGALTPTGAVSTSSGQPARDLHLVVGEPQLKWATGQPSLAWRAGEPEPKWTAGQPGV